MATLQNDTLTAVSTWAYETLAHIDAVIKDRVLVYGSLPPAGGDLDLLVRPAELEAIRLALGNEGFVPARNVLVRFRLSRCEMVELTPADSWELPSDELEALFAEARPLEGMRRLVRPSPHHALLIQARKALRRQIAQKKLLSRSEAAVAEDPNAWLIAAARAPAWRAQRAIALLKDANERGGQAWLVERWLALVEQHGRLDGKTALALAKVAGTRLPKVRRTYIVAFSGLDGSGKSSQARLLRDALSAAGQDTVVIWAGIGRNRSLARIKAPVKRVLRLLPRVGPLREVAERARPRPDGKSISLAEPGRVDRHHGFWFNLVTQVWLTVMALTSTYTLRKVLLRSFGRGRVIIFDRYTLDSAVRLRHWYGDSRVIRLVVRLIHLLVKRPIKAYYLDVPAQVAYARKPEWELDDLQRREALYNEEYARLGIRRLDGTRAADELCGEIAADVWRALR